MCHILLLILYYTSIYSKAFFFLNKLKNFHNKTLHGKHTKTEPMCTKKQKEEITHAKSEFLFICIDIGISAIELSLLMSVRI